MICAVARLGWPPFCFWGLPRCRPLSTGYFYCGGIFETSNAALIGNLTAVNIRQIGDEESISVENATVLCMVVGTT